MYKISEQQFEQLVQEAVESLPETHRSKIKNMGFFVRQLPSIEQARKAGLKPGMTLFGLYEGIPLSQRNGASIVMPDMITIFQEPIENRSNDLKELRQHVKHTVWHEVAHYFGLNHKQIYDIEDKRK
jgi:predicted Zn-dependent protease with MMP-like domain